MSASTRSRGRVAALAAALGVPTVRLSGLAVFAAPAAVAPAAVAPAAAASARLPLDSRPAVYRDTYGPPRELAAERRARHRGVPVKRTASVTAGDSRRLVLITVDDGCSGDPTCTSYDDTTLS